MHRRRSIRLHDYDYRQTGAYFVTICTHERAKLFGTIANGVMSLNDWGTIAQEEWEKTSVLRNNVELDAFVVMPNHIHGIIILVDTGRGIMHDAPTNQPHPSVGREFSKPVAASLSTIVGSYKAAVTRHINRLPVSAVHPIWQRNYYEHIIRNEKTLNSIRTYVIHNPASWEHDSLFVQ